MTRVKELTDPEKKIYRRLRSAFRRAMLGVIKRGGSMDEAKKVVIRLTKHAEKIGWLEITK